MDLYTRVELNANFDNAGHSAFLLFVE